MTETWTEDSSAFYRAIAQVAVPARAEQIAALLTLLPFAPDQSFRAVELASGEGRLAHALLSTFPNAHLLALDYSESMRDTTAQRLAEFGERASVAPFDMAQSDWYPHLDGVDCVLSSLCIHHLDGPEKQTLFQAVASRLSPGGVFLIADLIAPQRREASELFAATWDESARTQSRQQTGDERLFEQFASVEWNYYRYPDPSFDKPSPLFDQLVWLSEAGFVAVDCFWMNAGHAVYGGYKSRDDSGSRLDFSAARRAAENALKGDSTR